MLIIVGMAALYAAMTTRVAQSLSYPPSTSPILCRGLNGPLTIDGHSDDWARIESTYMDAETAQYVGGVSSGPADISASLRCAWDAQALYFYFDVTDNIAVSDSSIIYDDDSVEFALDGERDRACCSAHDHQITIAYDKRIAESGYVQSQSPVQFTVVPRSGGYAIEAAVPITMVLSTIPSSGTLIGFTWGLNDDDDGGRRDRHLIWSGSTMQDYSQFGDIMLAASLPSASPTATATQPASPPPTKTPTPPTVPTASVTAPAATATPTASATATATTAPTKAATATPTMTGTPGTADRVGELETDLTGLGGLLYNIWSVMQAAGYLPGAVPPLATMTPTVTPTPHAVGPVQRVNCGGPSYTDTQGNLWTADQPYAPGSWGYVGGAVFTTTSSISGTKDAPLYQTERYNLISYQFDVAPAVYQVDMSFAEIYAYAAPGQRVFDVVLQGTTVITGLDLYALVGPYTTYDRSFQAAVPDGRLTIDFVSRKGAAKINAVSIAALAPIGPEPTPSLSERLDSMDAYMSELERLMQQILAVFDQFVGM